MSVVAPPEPPRDAEALIREARARQLRRRAGTAAAVAILAGAALIAWGVAAAVRSGTSTGRYPFMPVVSAHALGGRGRLAFVSRDRLWLLNGVTRRLVRVSGAGASQPIFSPDGRWLAWSQGTKRFGIARSDGTSPRLLLSHGSSPAWLPDGRLLVGRAIYRIEGVVPVRAATAPSGLVSWLANGKEYAFARERLKPGRRHRSPFNEINEVLTAPSLTGPRKVWYAAPNWFTTRDGWRGAAIDRVAILPSGGILVWLDPMHSASIASDGLPVYEIRSRGARPQKLGATMGNPLSLGQGGRFALGAGHDRIAWTTKHVVTCAAGRCRRLAIPTGEISLDPAWSPGGRNLAYVTADDLGVLSVSTFEPTTRRWYATRRLWVGKHQVPGSAGAASPVWSANGRSLLFVARDGLWLLPRLDARPIRVASPLFWPHSWPGNYYGQITWATQFAWWSGK